MTFHDETFQRVSVAEAAKILGVSPSTVRRLVKAGKLVGESVLRPQGSAYVVRLPRDASTVADDLSGTSQPTRGEERSNASDQVFTESVKSPGEQMMAAWSAAVLTPILAPLVAEITASRQQLVSQAETIGRQSAELERAASTIVALGAEVERLRTPASSAPDESPVAGQETPAVPDLTTNAPVSLPARWRVLASWVPLLVMLALAVVTLLLTLAVLALTP